MASSALAAISPTVLATPSAPEVIASWLAPRAWTMLAPRLFNCSTATCSGLRARQSLIWEKLCPNWA